MVATVATLVFVPAVFSLLHSHREGSENGAAPPVES
jgi:hypothetical protein